MTAKHNNKVTLSQAAEMLGKSVAAVSRQLRRHGIEPDSKKRYLTTAVLQAAATGAEADKRRLSDADTGGAGLVAQRTKKQIERLTVEIETAEFRLSQLKGLYVHRDQHKQDVLAVYQAAIQTIDFWIKTTAAAIGSVDMKRRLEAARRRAYAAIKAELESATESATEPEPESEL